MARSMLIITRHSPWSGTSAREALDVVLAGGAFELPLGLLFLDDGVFQLISPQHPSSIQQKDLTANLQALSLFGIDELYASNRSLAERGIAADSLSLPVKIMQDDELTALIKRYDHVITI
ncbi:sulfurtransferase complex subunit TusC [Azomonas macrocytogenes]|uniref:tRNA 2-thiouridine synthesizing protein C n=1 Tax=Azomonas macrocytogenes TaxID=69962 RepID=A0A839T1L6_AZOMA|nr:sulfurtransferase complex subunit TusC [Azomonas macrocytogenes]MBB3101643.1 tRNA 2-thiouridine synthesizing protein C [Azomonas macrocytogenes]